MTKFLTTTALILAAGFTPLSGTAFAGEPAHDMTKTEMKVDAMKTDTMMKADSMKADAMAKPHAMKADSMMKADKMAAKMDQSVMTLHAPQSFTNKKYKIKGDWQIVKENGQTILRLSEDFKTKAGPDLKIFLSPQSINAVTGKTAVNGAVLVSKLTSNKGGQDYVIPAGLNLADYQSVLIHCEAFSVLWGGGAI